MIHIRKYQPTDFTKLLKLFELNAPVYFDPTEEAYFEDFLKSQPDHYFVLEENEKIVGCGGYDILEKDTIGRLTWDMLHPKAQGKGLGTMLINHCLESLKAIKTIQIIEVRTSQLAYTFYAHFGFELVEIKDDYWAKGFDLYYMRLVL